MTTDALIWVYMLLLLPLSKHTLGSYTWEDIGDSLAFSSCRPERLSHYSGINF